MIVKLDSGLDRIEKKLAIVVSGVVATRISSLSKFNLISWSMLANPSKKEVKFNGKSSLLGGELRVETRGLDKGANSRTAFIEWVRNRRL